MGRAVRIMMTMIFWIKISTYLMMNKALKVEPSMVVVKILMPT